MYSLIPIAEVAQLLGVSRTMVLKLIRDGKLRATKAFQGARAPWLVDRSDLDGQTYDTLLVRKNSAPHL